MKVIILIFLILFTSNARLIHIRKKKWKSTNSFVHHAAKKGIPKIYKKPPVLRKWKAFKKWSDNSYLSDLIGDVEGVYVQSESPVFGPYFDETRPLSKHTTKLHNYLEISSMSLASFLLPPNNDKQNNVTTFMYLTREIERVHPLLENDITPFDELIRLGPQKSSINIWMGHFAVTAPCHYDSYHNVYVQIRGKKTFYLASPISRNILRQYPFIHPSHAQCQVRLNPTLNASLSDEIDIFVAELEPGDVLYLPPMWFHEVIATSNISISVNGWTAFHDSKFVEELFSVPLPVSWFEIKLRSTFIVYISRMLINLFSFLNDINVDIFLSNLYNQRFESLVEAGIFSKSTFRNSFKVCSKKTFVRDKDIPRWSKDVGGINNRFDKNNRETWLGNFVEGLLLTTVGQENAQEVGDLLSSVQQCVKIMIESDADDVSHGDEL
jgi:hypothetical protein